MTSDIAHVHQAVLADRVEVRPGRYRFGDRTPVRPWMRVEFDGHFIDSECPTHPLGRIAVPLDWERIEREHTGDGLSFDTPWGDPVGWPEIRRAYGVLQAHGYPAVLDVELELRLLDDGTIGTEVWPSLMTVAAPVPGAIEEEINAILGRTPESYPHTLLYDRTANPTTMWFWA
jgi:hypothetical protein